jgi:tryptophan synthase alpha chain
MSRIAERFKKLHDRKEKALALFVTAGFPRRDSTPGLVSLFEQGGCDMVELGMPFSDPLADGPAIQESSARALANGVTLDSILENVRSIRKHSEIPIVLMGYLNPILRFGEMRFFAAAAASGVDGVILPEVPLEEFGRFSGLLKENALDAILLVTPASPAARIEAIDGSSSGFLYCVSTTGVTGTRVGGDPGEYLKQVKSHAHKNPLMVGFGISTPADARTYASVADGVIVGSALIRYLATSPTDAGVREWVRELKEALREK